MRTTSSRQRRQSSGALNRANSVASQSAWPNEGGGNAQAARTPASVYGQLTLPQPQFSNSPAASTEGNAQVKYSLRLCTALYIPCFLPCYLLLAEGLAS